MIIIFPDIGLLNDRFFLDGFPLLVKTGATIMADELIVDKIE